MDLTGSDLNQILREEDDEYERAVKQYYYDKIPDLFVWKLSRFSLEPSKVDGIIDRVRKSGNLILDLRGNSGGRVDMLQRLVGHFFPNEVKIGTEKKRKTTKDLMSKPRGSDFFQGKVVVLVDSRSASASEVFARVIQIEKRGTVIGDRSAGAVMESMYFGHQTGIDVVAFFGASITVADLLMTDGKSLEKTGVVPDELAVPTAAELADGRDRPMARAAEVLGFKLSPEEAEKLFKVDYEIRSPIGWAIDVRGDRPPAGDRQ
jgi:carboxyl-terminal processing protease